MPEKFKMSARMAPEGGRAIVALNGEISRWGFSPEAWDDIELWCQENGVQRVTLRINSPGGSLADAMSIIDRMQASGLEMEAEVFGLCASAATLVAIACKRVSMSRHSQFMVHHPYGVIAGGLEDMEAGLEVFRTLRQQAFDMYAARTGKDAAAIMADHAHDVWYSAKQAQEYGFIDSILGEEEESPATEEGEEKPDAGEAAEMYQQRGLLGSAALGKVAAFLGIRPSAKKQEQSRIDALTAQVAALQQDVTTLKAERDGAVATAAKAEAEAQATDARLRELVTEAVAHERARLSVNPAELPTPEKLKTEAAALRGLSTQQLLQRAAEERRARQA